MGAQPVMQKIEVTIPQQELVRVLVIDDDESFQTQMKEFFEALNCKVDVASSPENARTRMSNHSYQLVIADVNFDTSKMKGDRFVLDNERTLGPARVVVVTGQGLDTIDKIKKLHRRGIAVYEKSDDDLVLNLETIAQEKFEERGATFLKSIRSSLLSSLGEHVASTAVVEMSPLPVFDASSQLQDDLKQMLIDWLASRTVRDAPVLAFGTSIFTANEMIAEIQSDSEIGQAHVRMLVSEIKNCLGLVKNGSSEH